jgi:Uma2 family endonuclease
VKPSRCLSWIFSQNSSAVVDIPRLYEQRDMRLSYVIWQEGISPSVVVELLSPGTEDEDLGRTEQQEDKPPTKWKVYEQMLRVPYYVVFDRYTDSLQAFTLVSGQYQEITLTEPRIWMPTLKIGLGLWQGEYQGIRRLWLRWYNPKGKWILTEAEQERQRAERLAEQLRVRGIDPDALDNEL